MSLSFPSVPSVWGKNVSSRLCAGYSNGTPKREKCCFWIWFRPRYKIPEFFTIAPVLTSILTVCRRNRRDPSSLYRTRTYGALQILQNKKHSRSGLAWSRRGADRSLSRPTSYSVQQSVCAKFYSDRFRFGSTVRGQKNLVWSKKRERPSLWAHSYAKRFR